MGKEKSQSLRLHLLRYTFTVAEVVRRSSPEPNQQPNPISLKMATQQQTQQATAESPYDEKRSANRGPEIRCRSSPTTTMRRREQTIHVASSSRGIQTCC